MEITVEKRIDITDVTLADVRQMIQDKNIPDSAIFEYRGCGTHEVELVWSEDQEDSNN